MTTQSHHHSTPGAGGVPALLAKTRSQIRGLAETLWAARTPEELMDTVAEIEALKSTLDGLELAVVHELDATNAVKPIGWASTQDFLTATTGGHKGTGPAVVRLAKAVHARCWPRSLRPSSTGGSPPPRPRSSTAPSTGSPATRT